MKRFTSTSTLRKWLICLGILLGFAIPAQAVPVLSFSVSNPTPKVGDSITVDILALDVNDLFAFNLDVDFNPTILGITTIEAGNFLASGGQTLSGIGLFGFDTSTPGQIQDINDSLLGPVTGVTGNGVLATINFNVLALGVSNLAFLDVNGLAGTEMIDSTGLSITIENAAGATVTAVPEPSTVFLIASGIFAGVSSRRRYESDSKVTKNQKGIGCRRQRSIHFFGTFGEMGRRQ